MTFAGKVILVTGAGTGMGAATAKLLASRGARVVLAGRRLERLQEIAESIRQAGGEALPLATDVSKPEQVEAAVNRTIETYGALHHAVNNAGTDGGTQRLADLSVEEWQTTLGINLSGVFYGMKYQIPAIIAAGGGAIVNVSSVFSERALPWHPAYVASKHGVHGLTRAAARDYGADGIRINELVPGIIDTPMLDTNREGASQVAAFVPAGRIGRPEEIAGAIAFLLSDAATYINGARLAVDGGFLT